VKVLDFGLAKLTEAFSSGQGAETEAPTQPLNETSPGMIMGPREDRIQRGAVEQLSLFSR